MCVCVCVASCGRRVSKSGLKITSKYYRKSKFSCVDCRVLSISRRTITCGYLIHRCKRPTKVEQRPRFECVEGRRRP